LKTWLERQAPDFVATWLRFPIAIAMATLVAAIVIGGINDQYWLQQEVWMRAAFGLGTGAVFSVAGVYFAESRPEAKRWGFVLQYLVPLAAVGLFEVTDIAWFVPYALPAISILWLSVSPFTRVERGVPREEQQARFWIINHQALATAAIAGGAFLILALGFLIIERSLSMLFGLDTGSVFYKWLLPFTGLLLTPVYWLSTLPRLSEVQAREAERPEFIGKAVGFLGQFVLVPMLFIYALILLAYTGMIVVTQKLPQGMIGWMVMGFVIVGAATWLVLYPPFMRQKPLVKLFRRLWFWLTLVPLGLFFFAVWVRVDAYGLTSERMLLTAGGIWATALAAIFLLRRGDIRLIPALAGALLLVLSAGPWNYAYLPMQHQLLRLDTLVMDAGADKSASPPRSDWSAEEIAEARGIIDYLALSREGREATRSTLGKYGFTWAADQDGSYVVLEALGVDHAVAESLPRYASLYRDFDNQPVDVSATPFMIRPVGLYGDTTLSIRPLRFESKAGIVSVGPYEGPADSLVQLDITTWLNRQGDNTLVDPFFDFTVAGVKYRLVITSLTFDRGEDNMGPRVFSSLEGDLFADRVPTPTP
jgi:MFS family permease